MRGLEQSAIVVRPYIDFHPSEEWRVFIKDKKVVGITQYYFGSFFPQLTEEVVKSVDNEIRCFIEDIVLKNVELDNYVVDMVIGADDRPTVLLEMNPYGLSDPCLFVDYQSFDGSIKWIKSENELM